MSELGDRLKTAVREVVAERPDFVYDKQEVRPGVFVRSCVYVRDGQPSCLIGHALWRLGIIDANLAEVHNASAVSEDIPGLEFLSEEEISWLERAQFAQDTGDPWSAALIYADQLGEDDE